MVIQLEKILKKPEKGKKIFRVPVASLGGFPIEVDRVQSIAQAQQLESEGYGLKGESEERASPYTAVVLPDGRFVDANDLEEYCRRNKLNKRSKTSIMVHKAYQYFLCTR